jgi:predicted transporter
MKEDELIIADSEKENYSEHFARFRLLLNLSVGLTGFIGIMGVIFLSLSIGGFKKIDDVTMFLHNILFYVFIIFLFFALVSIKIEKKPFSENVSRIITVLGIIFILSAFILPQINGYKELGLVFLQMKNFTLMDGYLFLFGILFLLFAQLIKYGVLYQKEIDMTI